MIENKTFPNVDDLLVGYLIAATENGIMKWGEREEQYVNEVGCGCDVWSSIYCGKTYKLGKYVSERKSADPERVDYTSGCVCHQAYSFPVNVYTTGHAEEIFLLEDGRKVQSQNLKLLNEVRAKIFKIHKQF